MSRSILKSFVVALVALTMLLSSTSITPAADAQVGYGVVDFEGTDPIACGGQFFGSISGGVGPYTVTHVLTAADGTVTTLTPTIVEAAGTWTADNVDYAVIAPGIYSVTVTFVDAADNTATSSFTTAIFNSCTDTDPVTYPGPGTSVEVILDGIVADDLAGDAARAAAAGNCAAAAAAVASIEALDSQSSPAVMAALAAAKASAAACTAAAAPASAPVAVPANQLAFTGNEVSLPVTAGAILISAGGLMLLAANKRSRKDI